MWTYVRSFYSTEVEYAKLPKEVLNFLKNIISSVDSKTVSMTLMGANGGVGYLRFQVHTQGDKIEGSIFCKTAVAYHNYGFFEIFI